MILNLPVATIIEHIGHDGSEITDLLADEPDCRQSFHIQELIDVAWKLGYSVTPFEPQPSAMNGNGQNRIVQFSGGNQDRMLKLLLKNSGVLTGMTLSGSHHAVAWDHVTARIYNPNGNIQPIGDFAINTFWCIAQS